MCNIAPAGVAPAATTTAGGPVGTGSAPVSTDGITPIPGIPQPSTDVGGVSGGGPTGTPDLQAALEALHGAIGSLNGALQAMQGANAAGTPPVTGGGAGGCGCGQVTQGPAQLGGADGGIDAEKPSEAKRDEAHAHAHKPAPDNVQGASGPGLAPPGFKLKHPLPGGRLTSHFAEVSSIRNNRPHSGVDYAKPSGTPILSAAPGKILDVGFQSGGLGNYVYVDHGNGWVTRYGHMVEKSPLKKGDVVDAGMQIGKVGSTGNSTGPHLHFMVVKNGTVVNPEPFVNGEKSF